MKLSALPDFEQAAYHAGCSFAHAIKSIVALSRCRWFRVAVALGVFVAVALLAGCRTAPAVARPPVVSAPIVASQEGKDTTILAEAAQIDAIAPAAKPHTDAQRAAVAAAPAAQVVELVKAFEKQKAQDETDKATLRKERDDARNQTDRTIIIGGYALAALLVSAGVANFFLMAQVPILGPKIGYALIASGASIFVMLQAYQFTKAHPWIVGIAFIFLVAAASLAVANHAHAKDA